MKHLSQIKHEKRIRCYAPSSQAQSQQDFYIALLGWVNAGCPKENFYGFTQKNCIGANSVLYFRHRGWRWTGMFEQTVLPDLYEKSRYDRDMPFEGGQLTPFICDSFKYRNYARLAWITVYAKIPGDASKEFLGKPPKYQHPVLHQFYNDLRTWLYSADMKENPYGFRQNFGLCANLSFYLKTKGRGQVSTCYSQFKKQLRARHLETDYPFNTGASQYLSDRLYENPQRLMWILEYSKIPPAPPWYIRLFKFWR